MDKQTPNLPQGNVLLDIAHGLTGPVAGPVAGQFGYAAVYLIG
jgi:hypothetical protein